MPFEDLSGVPTARCTQCGLTKLRQFLAYLGRAHDDPGERWGNPHMTRAVRLRTIFNYHGELRTLFGWIVAEGMLEASPMERISPPIVRADQVQPFTQDQVVVLLSAARRSLHPRRDEALET